MAYDVDFEDRDVRERMANMIVESMATRTDADGHVTMALETILNHRKDDAAYNLQDRYSCLNCQRKLS